LSPLYRSVIQVCDIEGHSYSEAAEILKLRVTTMKARLYRGRCLLRQRVRLHMAAGIRSPAIDTTSPVNRNESQSL
jgi:RNA polymerase sigma-70 factor (ECF subfamily)